MASAEREPIMGLCPASGVQGQSLWLGGQGAKPSEVERICIVNG